MNAVSKEKRIKHVGADVGYDFVKIVTDLNNSLGQICFSGNVYKPIGTNMNLQQTDFSERRMSVSYKGVDYTLGDYAILQDTKGGLKDFDDQKYKTDEEIVKLFTGLLAIVQKNRNLDMLDEIIVENLGFGLSINLYNQYKEDVEDTFEDTTFEFHVPVNGNKKKIKMTIENVTCFAEGVGAFFDLLIDKDIDITDINLFRERFAVADLGGRTFDGIIGQEDEIIPNSNISLEYGVLNVFENVAKNHFENIPYPFIQKLYIPNDGLTKKPFKGKTITSKEVRKACDPHFKELVNEIYSQIKNRWKDQLDFVAKFVNCGGAASILEKYLNEKFEKEDIYLNIGTSDRPQLANARGFYKMIALKSS